MRTKCESWRILVKNPVLEARRRRNSLDVYSIGYASIQLLFGWSESRIDRFQRQSIGNQEEIDIAGRRLLPFGDRSIDQSKSDLFGDSLQRSENRVFETHSLSDDAAEFVEKRRVAIGLVVLLVANPEYGRQFALGQTAQFALNSASAQVHQVDDLGHEETAIRLAEQ